VQAFFGVFLLEADGGEPWTMLVSLAAEAEFMSAGYGHLEFDVAERWRPT
jgi:hypothetical protein